MGVHFPISTLLLTEQGWSKHIWCFQWHQPTWKKWYIRNGRTQPLIFVNNLSPELVINYFIKRVGLSSRSLRAAASGEDHTPPGIDGIRWQPLVAGLGEKLSRQGSDTYYCHFMHENTEINGKNESISFLLKNDNYF